MHNILKWTTVVVLVSLLPINAFAQDSSSNLSSLRGRIAYVGLDGNIYTLNLQEDMTVVLTSDGRSDLPYRWPTWSTDGRLAYFTITAASGNVQTNVFVSHDGTTPGSIIYSGANQLVNYAYWSPQDCADREPCRDLAVLMGQEEGLSLKLVRHAPGEADVRSLGTGRPFYFSWSPDGSRMLWQRNNERLDVYDITAEEISVSLPVIPGAFQAPAWSPIDDRMLFARQPADAESNELVIYANETDQRVLAQNLVGPVAFAWSPNGNMVAYTDNQGALLVIDANTGERISQSASTGVYAFFWSPDSNHIAYITASTPPGSFTALTDVESKVAAFSQRTNSIAWSVLDIETGFTRRYGAFVPTQEMLYILVYFDQFAQSHRIWSPDSQYLIYGELTPAGEAILSLLDALKTDTVPLTIADGHIGIWSFE